MRTLLIPLLLTLPALSDTYIHNSTISNSIIGSNISNTTSSRSSGTLSTKTVHLGKIFNSIAINLPANITIHHSPKQSMTITMEKKFLKNISTSINNNQLNIATIGSINTRSKINITINMPLLSGLDVRSTAKVTVNNFNINSFKLSTAGTSRVTFLSGRVQNFFLNSSGTSKISLEAIDVKNATIVSKGTSKTRIKVDHKLNVDLSNIAKVMYIGNPIINKKLTGLGKLIKIQ